MSGLAIETSAQLLWRAWADGELLAGLPGDPPPSTLADAYRVQFAMDRMAGERVGWKLAATGAGGRADFGIDQPLAGPLYRRFQIASGAKVDFAALRMSTVEAEFGLQLGRDLPAHGAPYDHDTVSDALSAFVPAIELPNTRYLDHRRVGAVALTCDAALGGLFAFGEPRTDFDPDSLSTHRVELRTPNGLIEAIGAAALGDPVEAVRWLVNELGQYGYGLREGDVVITGAAAATREPGIGLVVADYGVLGQLEVELF